MQDDPVRKWKVGGGEWDDSLRKIGHLRSKCYGRITRLIPFFRCAERYFQAFNCNSPGVSGGVSIPIMQPFQAELAYAWFVASGSVTATGMQVTAQSEGGLAISYGGTAWATTATAEMTSAKQLFPASTNNLATWVHATATAPSSFAAAAKDYTNVTGQVFNEGSGTPKALFKDNNYVVMKEFLVRSTATDTASLSKGLFVKDIAVTITKNGSEVAAEKRLSTALRVGVQCGSNSYIFGPVTVSTDTGSTSATNNYQVYNADGTANGDPVVLATEGQTSVLVASTEAITNATSGVPVYIYIWFEGEDHELFSDNMYLENLNVSVEFQSFSSVTT